MPSLRIAFIQGALAVALVIGCLAAATQWTAAMLAYQPALGAPWFMLFSLPVYPFLTEEERAYVVQEVNAAC